jgi:hypothetical protein
MSNAEEIPKAPTTRLFQVKVTYTENGGTIIDLDNCTSVGETVTIVNGSEIAIGFGEDDPIFMNRYQAKRLIVALTAIL